MSDGVQDAALRRRVMRACLGFVLGFSTVFVSMGIGAVAVGHTVRTWRVDVLGFEVGAAQLAGLVIIVLGLHMTGLIPIRLVVPRHPYAFEGQPAKLSEYVSGGRGVCPRLVPVHRTDSQYGAGPRGESGHHAPGNGPLGGLLCGTRNSFSSCRLEY